MELSTLLQLSWIAGIVALVLAVLLYFRIKALPRGNAKMQSIGNAIQDGAMAFLMREFKVLAVYIVVLFGVLAWGLSVATASSFVLGALLSLLAGFVGMKAATMANTRTAEAAREKGRGDALMVAFDGGAVMGLCVAGLGILGLTALYLYFQYEHSLAHVLHGFGVGASSIALFARIGGGIYTKAADVGADLAGKVVAGIPEDDPRNPGVIADNVGDNVGDVAGMGADIYESYVAATVAAIAIALTMKDTMLSKFLPNASEAALQVEALREHAKALPLWLAGIGLVVCIVAIAVLRIFKNTKPDKALRIALLLPPVIFIALTWVVISSLGLSTGIVWVVASGAIGGGIIGLITDYYTSARPVLKIAEASRTGAATSIIKGISVGLESLIVPILVLCVVIYFSNLYLGLYGVAIAAVSMLAVTAMVMTVDAYGPIADNGGGISEMSGLGKEVRDITDELDAVGNTTAAIGKGFAIGSAVLTAIALFVAYNMEIDAKRLAAGLEPMTLLITDARVLIGVLIGGLLPCIVGASTMNAVGNAAGKIVQEIARQFKEIPGLLEGKEGVEPDSRRCVDIATKAALNEMLLPGVVAIMSPPLIGFLLGAEALAGALVGATIVGAVLSLFMANTGGAWDNAKKFIEKGGLEGAKKGSEAHKASVVADTVGDPFKDTSGPGISILIKVMSVVSLMIATLL